MREILFKAKSLDNGEWVEGSYAYVEHLGEHFILSSEKVDMGFDICFTTSQYRIDENTLCQYTGLTDKNGHAIWENDIIRHEDLTNGRYIFREQPMKNSYIKWNKFETRFERNDGGSLYYSKKVEVVGNIFDNPELLEGVNKNKV